MEHDEIAVIKVKDQLLASIERDLGQFLRTGEPGKVTSILQTLQSFQPAPQLLDRDLKGYISACCAGYVLERQVEQTIVAKNSGICDIFYQFSKVRGMKTIGSCLTSDVYLMEPILEKLQLQFPWKEKYFLLSWLSIVVLNPFQLESVHHDLAGKIYALGLSFLHNSGKEADAAVVLLTKFLTRADSDAYLAQFYNSISELSQDSEFVIASHLSILNGLLKSGKISSLEPFIELHYRYVQAHLESNNVHILKLCLKNLGKLGEVVIALNKIELLEEIINFLISKLDYASTVVRNSASKQLAKIATKLDTEFQVELLEMLIQDLDISNYSLQAGFSDLDLDYDMINVDKYHGTLLTLAEFSNLRLIPAEMLPAVISLLHKTLFVEQDRLTYSIGSNVRDASCYNAWSLIRRYREFSSATLKQLFQDLLLTCLFDKEIMIRRAASAVIQELIGRHGNALYTQLDSWKVEQDYFKLKSIEWLDFTVLGDIKKSYSLAHRFASDLNESLRGAFLSHLYTRCFHSDYEIRKLSIEHFVSLVASAEVDKFISKTLVQKKPGQLYLLAELLKLSHFRVDDITTLVRDVSFNSHKDSASTGEEILYLISELMPLDAEIFKETSDLIFNIIRMTGSDAIAQRFESIVGNLPGISDEFFERLIYHVKMGNNAPVARCFRAFQVISPVQLDKILDVIDDPEQDSDVRSELINSLAIYFHRSPFTEAVIRIITQLDDYTITSQGDVGSRLRLATVRFIELNLATISKSPAHLHYLNSKLVRLNFDMIDKLRLESFELSCKTLKFDPIEHYGAGYFDHLLFIYVTRLRETDLALEFWKGYALISGSLISSNKLVQASLNSLLQFVNTSPFASDPFALMAAILSKTCEFSMPKDRVAELGLSYDHAQLDTKTNDRRAKLQTCVLVVFERLLEYNVVFPSDFDFKALFVKVYNLQLNQLNPARLRACFKLFKLLYLMHPHDPFFQKGKTRMIQLLCTGKHDRVRVCCSEILYEFYFEEDADNDVYLKKLDAVNWTEHTDLAQYLKFFH